MICYSIFDRKGKLEERVWKMLKISGLSPGFMRMGVTVASLSVWGT